MFDMDLVKAYSFLNELEEKFDLKNNDRVQRINRYTPEQIDIYEVDASTAQKVSVVNKEKLSACAYFEELFV